MADPNTMVSPANLANFVGIIENRAAELLQVFAVVEARGGGSRLPALDARNSPASPFAVRSKCAAYGFNPRRTNASPLATTSPAGWR